MLPNILAAPLLRGVAYSGTTMETVKGKYYPAQWRRFIGHVGYKTRADMERLEKTENPGLEIVNKYWELMMGTRQGKSSGKLVEVG